MRLIDADALDRSFSVAGAANEDSYTDGVLLILRRVEDAPTVDAVPVVRCRECKMHGSCYTEDVFKFARLNADRRFCGVGEQKGVGK